MADATHYAPGGVPEGIAYGVKVTRGDRPGTVRLEIGARRFRGEQLPEGMWELSEITSRGERFILTQRTRGDLVKFLQTL